jgi:tetratricopeptide (TPR) repeat protein
MEKKETIPFEVDFLGNGSFQVTQLNLLTKRSMEPTQNSDAQLSARGLHHRKREQFERDIKSTTNVIMMSSIQNNIIADNSEGKSLASQPKFHLFGQYFQRALAYERLGQIDKAISDYNTVLGIYPEYAPAHFNRAGLYNAQGHIDMALTGINQAITLDPSNLLFRQNKSMILRQKGNYMEAINETMVIRAVQMQPSLAKELIAGNTLNIPDSTQLILGFRDNTPIDEVSLAMDWKKKESSRNKEPSEKRRDTSLILQPIPSSSHSQLKVLF